MAKRHSQSDGRGRDDHGQADGHPFHQTDGLLQLAERDVQGAGDAGGEAEHHTGGGGRGLWGEVLGGHDHHGAARVEEDAAHGGRDEERQAPGLQVQQREQWRSCCQ
jgi:hypothetical protein